MSPIPGPRALLEISFVLGAHTTRVYSIWSYKVISGATIRKRLRASKLAVGVQELRWESDGDQVLILMKALGDALDQADRPKAPAPPGGGVTGGEQWTLFDDLQDG